MVLDGSTPAPPDAVGENEKLSGDKGVSFVYRENEFYSEAMPRIKAMLESNGIADIRLVSFPQDSEPLSIQTYDNPWEFNDLIKGTNVVYDNTSKAFIQMLSSPNFDWIWEKSEAEDTKVVIDELFKKAVEQVLAEKIKEKKQALQEGEQNEETDHKIAFQTLLETAMSHSRPEKIVIETYKISDHWDDPDPVGTLTAWLTEIGYSADDIVVNSDPDYYYDHKDEFDSGKAWALVDRHADVKVNISKGKIFVPMENTIDSLRKNGLLNDSDFDPGIVEKKFTSLLLQELGIEAPKE